MIRFFKFIILLIITLVLSYEPIRAECKVITAPNGLAVEEKHGWIKDEALDFDSIVKPVDPTNGLRMLLISTQSNYTRTIPEIYFHSVTQISNTSILEENSTVSLDYKPAFQSYSVINLSIIRGDLIPVLI